MTGVQTCALPICFDFDWELLIKLVRRGYRPLEMSVNYRSRSFKEGKKIRMFRDPLTEKQKSLARFVFKNYNSPSKLRDGLRAMVRDVAFTKPGNSLFGTPEPATQSDIDSMLGLTPEDSSAEAPNKKAAPKQDVVAAPPAAPSAPASTTPFGEMSTDEKKKDASPNIRRLLGLEGDMGKNLGLANEWAYNIVKQVGNYSESFERNLGSGLPLKIARGQNALWSKGGLQYSMPIR